MTTDSPRLGPSAPLLTSDEAARLLRDPLRAGPLARPPPRPHRRAGFAVHPLRPRIVDQAKHLRDASASVDGLTG